MYTREREKLHKYPSFSTSLLDEIYRSIDGFDEEKHDDPEVHKHRICATNVKTFNNKDNRRRHGCPKAIKPIKIGNNVDDEEEDVMSFRRACLVEKWMEQKVSDKVLSTTTSRMGKKPPSSSSVLADFDNDPLFFSSGSSSDSSSGALSSSSSLSDTEFLDSTRTSKTSCFSSSWPKPVRTSVVTSKSDENPATNDAAGKSEFQENFIKSKSAALKMYQNLKKMKQPISPGARLTNFLNSIFANHGKAKSAAVRTSSEYQKPPPPPPQPSTSRSCLNKTPRAKNNNNDNGVKRTVRFDPVGVIVDEDCRPCGHKRIYAGGEYPAPEFQEIKKIQGVSRGIAVKSYNQHWKKNNSFLNEEEDEDHDDNLSESSSDLFEIDHLAMFGNRRFREELPVYETTHLDTNRAIASGYIR